MVDIIIIGTEETDEYKAAIKLRDIIRKCLPDSVTGKIKLLTNCILHGEIVKDVDLIISGELKNYKLKLFSKVYIFNNRNDENCIEREVNIDDFVFTVEIKGHPSERVHYTGTKILVEYQDNKRDATSKKHDASNQSEKQKRALINYSRNRRLKGDPPWVCNFIWFTSISESNIKKLLDLKDSNKYNHNVLPSQFNLPYLFQLACIQRFPAQWNNGSIHFKSFSKDYKINEFFNLFTEDRTVCGDITRYKLEEISKKILKNQKYAEAIGEKLVIISGRAGTGKTFKLLHIAFDLAQYKGECSLILTYNKALVSDIQRLLYFADISYGITSNTVNIMTLHSFFMELSSGLGVTPKKDFIENYDNNIKELKEYIENGLVTEKDIQDLMRERHELAAWDFIMIDEAQDWFYFERDILNMIFGYKQIIIADGNDQLIRRTEKCDWDKDLTKNDVHKKEPENISLRQKDNLVSFVNDYAENLGLLEWNLKPNEKLIGGKIIITSKPYNKELHMKEYEYCKQNGNIAYDYMFLVPPALVDRNYSNGKEIRKFKLIDKYYEMGIKIWDGTSIELRTEYPVNTDEHRLFQYDSCRGLEGWTIVCLNFDEFIDYKYNTYEDKPSPYQLTLESEEERRLKYVNMWSLIPLTRAIDTIIITLKDGKSKHAKILYELHKKHKDFIDFIT